MGKNILFTFILGILSTVSLYGNKLNPYDKFTLDGIEYKLSPEGYLIVNSAENNLGFANIPNTIEVDGITYNVGELSKDLFKHNMNLSGTILPDNLRIISADVFYNCYQLRAIAIPASVTSIGDSGYGVKPVFEDTPLETISFLGTEVPKGDLDLIFKSPYLKQIVVPAEAAESFESKYPSIKEGRIKIRFTVPSDLKYYYFKVGSSFIPFQHGYYPLYVANSSAAMPDDAIIYVTPNNPLPILLNQPDIAGNGGIDIKINGAGSILKVNADMPSSIMDKDKDYSYRVVFAGMLISGLEEGSHIVVTEDNASVNEIENQFPEIFSIYTTDGILVKENVTYSYLTNLNKNIYILNANGLSSKVFVGDN